MTKAELGRYAQARFVADAMAQGVIVFAPSADYPCIDLVAMRKRKCYRVQVKAVRKHRGKSSARESGYRVGLMRTRKGSVAKRYPAGCYDILAVFLKDEDTWVFIPEKSLPGTMVQVTPGHGRARNVNNWRIFR
jgi:hypothetical protein